MRLRCGPFRPFVLVPVWGHPDQRRRPARWDAYVSGMGRSPRSVIALPRLESYQRQKMRRRRFLVSHGSRGDLHCWRHGDYLSARLARLCAEWRRCTERPGGLSAHGVYGRESCGHPALVARRRTRVCARGAVAFILAILLASSSVFRKLPRRLRLGGFLEGHQSALRAMQSGHPGDYVLWITIGLAVFGSAAMFLLRG